MTYQTDRPCIACNEQYLQRTYHHIHTRKARPDLAECEWNKVPVCFICHARWHNMGTSKMAERFPSVKVWLESNGWEYSNYLNKWTNEEAMQGM